MIRLTRAQPQAIGVDIGSDSVKLMQVETAGPQLSVLAAAREYLPSEARGGDLKQRTEAAVDLVRQCLRKGPFVGKNIVAALPRDIVHVKNLRLPLMPVEELESAIEFEARNLFSFDIDRSYLRFIPAGEVRQGTDARQEVIVLAAQHEEVDNFLVRLHRCGATVQSLDFEAAAIYRSVERFIRRREDEQEVHVLVDVGARRTQVIIGRGRDISFIKPIEIGGNTLHEAVARKLGISEDEARSLRRRLSEQGTSATEENARRDSVRQAVFDATRSIMETLAREVSLCLRYYSVTFRGQRPSKLRLVGGEAADPQLQAVLNAGLPVPAEAGKPLNSIDSSRMRPTERRGYMSEWTVAFGLGLKLTTGHFGARDGKQRDPSAVRPDLSAAMNLATEPIKLGEGGEASLPPEVAHA